MFFLEDGICGHFSCYFHAIRTRLPGLATILEQGEQLIKKTFIFRKHPYSYSKQSYIPNEERWRERASVFS